MPRFKIKEAPVDRRFDKRVTLPAGGVAFVDDEDEDDEFVDDEGSEEGFSEAVVNRLRGVNLEQPTPFAPGSPEKQLLMQRRYHAGVEMHIAGDCRDMGASSPVAELEEDEDDDEEQDDRD